MCPNFSNDNCSAAVTSNVLFCNAWHLLSRNIGLRKSDESTESTGNQTSVNITTLISNQKKSYFIINELSISKLKV